ncbi:YraN family protein [uncultured Tateyamaria sp.]|uniref:YraN family protein n=1 Tax=uncultured Tateyamaria sp. TaxID=455651 RepID=UPI00262D3816|nr:YraN family protein [uncultured Tateyamaria sp.]
MTRQAHADFAGATPVVQARMDRGRRSYLAGLAAEDIVRRDYAARGFPLRDSRWRGKRGEIDLVMNDGDGIVFVEVKKSRDFETAMSHVTAAQVRRLYATGEEYLAQMPNGSLTDVRFDVALVDATGAVQIVENAFGHVF